MKKTVLLILAAMGLLLGTVGVSRAEDESKPLVTVSVASYDKLMADISTLGKLGGNPGLGKQVEAAASILPQGTETKTPLSLDTKQPIGIVVVADNPEPKFYAFLPIHEIDPLLDWIRVNSGMEINQDNDIYEIPTPNKSIYATHKGTWAFITDAQALLEKLPTDPSAQLTDLPKRYDLAVLASIKNLPKEYRDQFLSQLKAGAEAGMQKTAEENDEEFAMRAGMAKQSVEYLTMLVNDLDSLMFGWNIDAKTKSTYLDVEITAKSGTKLSEQLALVKPGKSRFTGLLLPNAALTACSISTLSDNDAAQAKAALGGLRKSAQKEMENRGIAEADAKAATQLISDVIDVMQKTIDGKKTDSAMSLVLEPNASMVLVGTAIADGAKLQASLQKLMDQYKNAKENEGSLKVGTEQHGGLAIYAISIPSPSPELTPVIGETLDIAVGVSNDTLLFAAGHEAAAAVKNGIDQLQKVGSKDVPPMQIILAAKPIAKFIANIGDDNAKATAMMLSGLLEIAGDKDHITLTSKPMANGVAARLELEEGLLKVFGTFSKMMSPNAPQQ